MSVTDNTAQVKTIIDSSSSISAVMNTSEETIVCKGTLDEEVLKAMYIPTEANVIQGDTIKTSGIGGIYPKGIHIGTIETVINTKNIVDRYAEVKPAVDFDKLNNILVIKND